MSTPGPSASISSARLTNAEAELLLSLPDWELESFLRQRAPADQAEILQQLENYRTPTELATDSLHEFVRQAWAEIEPSQEFVDNWHIAEICRHLEAVTDARIPSLLVNVPPGGMKSILVCVMWPSWVWAKKPAARFMFASYTQELSTRDSVKMRYLIESPWYQERWGHVFRLMGDQNQKIKYETSKRGWRLATSVGGRGTGEHPDYLVVDDAHSAVEAESDKERQAAIEWWDGTISTRGVSRGVRRVVIGQRLHVNDLPGHLLKRGGFDHLCLPMEYEAGQAKETSLGRTDPRETEGELLWPELFTRERVDQIKKDLGAPHKIAGQLQQRPYAREGGMFKREWFQIVRALPEASRWLGLRYWDKAGTQDGGAHTAGVLMCCAEGLIFVAGVIRGQWSARNREKVIGQTADTDRRAFSSLQIWMEQEPGSGGKESAEESIIRLAGYVVRAERPVGNKVLRADEFACQCEAGNVRLVEGPWNEDYLNEFTAFPNGGADQVDASSGAFRKLVEAIRYIREHGDQGGHSTEYAPT